MYFHPHTYTPAAAATGAGLLQTIFEPLSFPMPASETNEPGGLGWRARILPPSRPEDPSSYHTPVLLEETLRYLAPKAGRRFVDCTLGGGGHTEALLERGAEVIGFDRDPAALATAQSRCEAYGDRLVTLLGNYAEFGSVLDEVGLGAIDGILIDLGVSSHQLDTAERGFSFQKEGPLDMRMGPDVQRTAADLVNELPEEELVRILREYGEEHQAKRIVRAILKRRATRPFETTSDLAGLVEDVKPRRGRVHPATKTFQALRIAVNDELENLEWTLEAAVRWLKPGGRLAVITFHSLEDRIVKHFLRSRSEKTIDRPEWPAPKPNPNLAFRLLTKKPVTASSHEIETNPRARSAKLRAAERLPQPS